MAAAVRFATVSAAVAAALAVSAWPATAARGTGISFVSIPNHALQGDDATVMVSVRPAGARCTLTVRYLGGTVQPGLPAVAAPSGRAAWKWTVPTTVQAGAAQATVRCGKAAATRKIVIVGRLFAPKIVVKQQGFSLRPQPFQGTRLSYGLILHNDSTDRDAKSIVVQTNFVMSNGFLLGTDAQRVEGIPAAGDFALGNTVSFPGAAPIVRLETVITVGEYAKAAIVLPTLANIHLVPGVFDPDWLGTVEGEVQNTDPALTLRSAQCSAVVFDASGNIVGGGTGWAFQTLPPGAREALQLANGFDVIPMERASSVMVSMTPTWQQPGT